MKSSISSFHLSDFFWDAWCVASLIGIWPRFIEPALLEVHSFPLSIPSLPLPLEGLKIVQFSDLHLHKRISERFLAKLQQRIMRQQPDVIVFTGDFLCYAHTDNPERLKTFLNSLHAPYGCYAILGNHDYQAPITVNAQGEYDLQEKTSSNIKAGFTRLFSTPLLNKKFTEKALAVPPNKELQALLSETPFRLLHNETVAIPIKEAYLNICGLGEYMAGRTLPEQAFAKYKEGFPGIILLHNPDGVPLLNEYPGELVLCGHTHGGQVYLPFLWKRFTLLENIDLLRGLKQYKNKAIYINRGVAGIMPFRWRARPEILTVTLRKST